MESFESRWLYCCRLTSGEVAGELMGPFGGARLGAGKVTLDDSGRNSPPSGLSV